MREVCLDCNGSLYNGRCPRCAAGEEPECDYCGDAVFGSGGYGTPCMHCPVGLAAHHSEVRGTFG